MEELPNKGKGLVRVFKSLNKENILPKKSKHKIVQTDNGIFGWCAKSAIGPPLGWHKVVLNTKIFNGPGEDYRHVKKLAKGRKVLVSSYMDGINDSEWVGITSPVRGFVRKNSKNG